MKNLIVMVCLSAMFFSCAKKIQPEPGVPRYCRIHSVNDSTGKPLYYIEYVSPSSDLIKETYTIDNTGNKVTRSKYCYNSINNLLDSIVYTNKDMLVYEYVHEGYIGKITEYKGWGSQGFSLITENTYVYGEMNPVATVIGFVANYDMRYLKKFISNTASPFYRIQSADTLYFEDYTNGRPTELICKDASQRYKLEYDASNNLVKAGWSNNKSLGYENMFSYNYDRNIDFKPTYKILKQLDYKSFHFDSFNPNLNTFDYSTNFLKEYLGYPCLGWGFPCNSDIGEPQINTFTMNKYGKVSGFHLTAFEFSRINTFGINQLKYSSKTLNYNFTYQCQ